MMKMKKAKGAYGGEAVYSSEIPAGFKSDFDWRACGLLAQEYEHAGQTEEASCIRLGMPVDHASHLSLTALTVAVRAYDSLANDALEPDKEAS